MKKNGSWVVLAITMILLTTQGAWAIEEEKAKSSTQKSNGTSDKSVKQDYQFSPPVIFPGTSDKTASSGKSEGVGAALEPKKQEVGEDYRILIGDRLNVKIFPEDPYIKGGTMQVSSEGNITLPLVGKVNVADKTLVEAGRDLAKIIDADYLVDAEAVVEVVESITKSAEKRRKAIVLGQVRRPGSYELPPEKDKISLLELVSLAGGFTEIANIKKIKVIQKVGMKKETQSVNGENIMNGSAPDIELGDGDVINVAESVF